MRASSSPKVSFLLFQLDDACMAAALEWSSGWSDDFIPPHAPCSSSTPLVRIEANFLRSTLPSEFIGASANASLASCSVSFSPKVHSICRSLSSVQKPLP
uniref:Putative secreted protein n=1 Tax=Ixodes ricinus TaxID=34613 RepID=A0A6B0UEM9_IXORI